MKAVPAFDQLLNDAAEWRLISLLFDCPNKEWFEQVKVLGEQVSDERLRSAAVAAQTEATEGIFHSIFGPGGPAPGREVSYRSWVQPGYLLSELNGFYDAFSYKPATHEVPDHVAVETGFVAYLKLKQLYARECRDTENETIAEEASSSFLDNHLSKYTQTLAKLLSDSGYQYLELAGEVLFEKVGPDKDKGKQIFLPIIEEENEEDSMFECGGAAM